MKFLPMARAIKLSLTVLFLSGLVACGGGGGGGSSSTTKQPEPSKQLAVANDAIASIPGRAGASNISLISNDTLNNAAVSLDDITLTVQSADGPLSLAENATLSVAPMTAAGNYSLTYQACLVADSSICAEGNVSVEVLAATLMANTDTVTGINGGMENTNIVDVLANDTIDGMAIPASEVSVSVSLINSGSVITMTNNMASLTANTTVGNYALTYQVCENLNPTNCTTSELNLSVDKGQFLLGKATGVKYVTNSGMGFTDANGGFIYESGDTISFYVGATKLGQTINASAIIGPVDLVPGSFIPTTKAQTDSYLNTFWNYQSAPKMHQLGNILTLLFSIDSDKDFANGIQIDEGLHTQLDAKEFNLAEKIGDFRNNPIFKRTMYDAFNSNFMVNARRVDYLQAMDLFAKYNNVSPHVFITTKTQRDDDNNGTIDQINQSIVDENGYIVGYQTDNNADGVLENNSVSDYNEYGQVLSSSNYSSGILTRSTESTYDINGEQLQQTIDTNGDGKINQIITYVVDNYGNTLEMKSDNDGDGTTDRVIYYQYNDQNQVIKTSTDVENDNTIDNSTFYSYEGDLQTQLAHDNNGDNVIDSITYFSYNSAGLRTLTENDFDNDGNIDQKAQSVYNAENNITLNRQDNNNDGNWDYERTSSYNNDGKLLEIITDSNGDGTFNTIVRYTYNQQNQVLTYKSYSNGDADSPRSASYYEYDDSGNQISYTREQNGSIISIYAYTFDEQGNQITQSIDNDADGTADSFIFYSFDEFGNQIQQTNDTNGDGKINTVINKEYSRLSLLGWYIWD